MGGLGGGGGGGGGWGLVVGGFGVVIWVKGMLKVGDGIGCVFGLCSLVLCGECFYLVMMEVVLGGIMNELYNMNHKKK